MLLEFRATNYKSFRDELVFSLVPAPKQKGLDYSVLMAQAGTRTYKGLCSAVIYGANASGKTNIIGAMDAFKMIMLRGNIRNDSDRSSPNAAASALELIPNNSDQYSNPVKFAIKFIERNLLIEYAFSADIGRFLEVGYARKILSETLKVNEKPIFSRDGGLEIGPLSVIQDYLVDAYGQNARSAISLAKGSLNDQELFLMNGFKTMFSSELTSLIAHWLDSKFMVIYRADAMHLIQRFGDLKKNSVYVEKTLNEAARCFGINSNALGYVIKGDGREAKLCSLFGEPDEGVAIPAEVFESYGTMRFVNMFPLVVYALWNGGTLVVDEFDASIHPMALMSIINIFHNDDINIHGAQLIFNTHNPIFLNANLFRRDEIKFVERDDDTRCSTHYSLSDFGTKGKAGVRKNGDYMKNYFIDRYGAIKDVDFTPIFEGLLEGGEREEV